MIYTLFLYAISSLAVTIIPGPTMMLALSNGMTKSKSAIFMGILGAACSDIILLSLIACGIGAILSTSEMVFDIVKMLGAAYLCWLSYKLWRAELTCTIDEIVKISGREVKKGKNAFLKSFFAALLNSKGIIFFGAFVPQFVDVHQNKIMQYLLFTAITIIIDIFIMACYAFAGVKVSSFLSQKKIRLINRLCSIIILCIAISLSLLSY